MIKFVRPMLAASLLPAHIEHTDENILAAMQKLRYPVLATVKFDGIRALRLNGTLLSRSLKQTPNKSIRERSLVMPGGFDMELWNPDLSYNQIESIVMSREHTLSDKIQFHVLDWFRDGCYEDRCWRIVEYIATIKIGLIKSIGVTWIYCAKDLLEHFLNIERNLDEGICFRTPNSPYKQGRSTLKEQYLVKLCRYLTDEATIIGFEEQQLNANQEAYGPTGLMDRSSFMDRKLNKNTLGALIVKNTKGQVFNVGTGLDLNDELRAKIWDNQDKYLGHVISYRYKGGGKELPRSPTYRGFRSDI